MKRLISICSILCLSMLSIGCGPEKGGDSPVANSPNEVFATAQAAMEAKDWGAIYECCSPESRGVFTMLTVMGAKMNAMADEEKKGTLDELHKKHGLNPEKKLTTSFMKDAQGAAAELLAEVKDQKTFFVDMMDWCASNSVNDAISQLHGTLGEVKIDGASATGTVVKKGEDGEGGTKEINFLQVDGKWYLDFDLK